MAQPKLFDYNSSFQVIRTNPALTGNLKVTIQKNGKVSFNSINANEILSNDRFKNFNITGQNSFPLDVYNFFDKGQLSKDIIFQVGELTQGNRQTATQFSEQYDFFYASGAQALADKNYLESFSYFAPLWIRSQIPDFFVIFKVPGPLSYPYSTNQTTINSGVRYKIVQNYNSTQDFIISYGKDPSGNDINYRSGEIFTGNSAYSSYSIVSGSGLVVIFNELENLDLVDNVENLFSQKILPNCSVVETFDLRENTKIGSYIRGIFNDKNFSDSPVDLSFGPNSYSYFKGASVSEGIFSKKGEILGEFLSSDRSDKMIDFESYITGGFSRNDIICPNLLNLEFLFDDPDSNLYTINRYFGMYVSRNDLASFKLNGDFFYQYRNLVGNNDFPKPTRNSFGYYYDTNNYLVGATSGVRIFYENASGFMPGSDNVNILNPDKLFYITDKFDNFYSLKRNEGYNTPGGNSPDYSYGVFDFSSGSFSATGSTGATAGNLVLQDQLIDLLDFTGISSKLATIPGTKATQAGSSYTDVRFIKVWDQPATITLKIYWPNGSQIEGAKRFDLIQSANLSSIQSWPAGAFYSDGNTYYFNAQGGTSSDAAFALSGAFSSLNSVTWYAGAVSNNSVVRLKNSGTFGDSAYSVSIFDNYPYFNSVFQGEWSNTLAYSAGNIVIYYGNYYQTQTAISVPSPGTFNSDPLSSGWDIYKPFSASGYIRINGIDASQLSGLSNFKAGTQTPNNRIIFPVEYDGLIGTGNFIKTKTGFTRITSVSDFVDKPITNPNTSNSSTFADFEILRVLNFQGEYSDLDLGSDNSFNVYQTAQLNAGVFSFFDTKELDFDFLSSPYGYAPTPETYKYFQLQPDLEGVIESTIPYIVKQGQASYNGSVYYEGDLFFGVTGSTSFSNANPNLYKSIVVFPAEFSDISYSPSITNYGNQVGYNTDLNSFNGFIGIQQLAPPSLPASATKLDVFSRGKLQTEYSYLEENFTPERANISRIVPYINKWSFNGGTDARGNSYRLNSSPAFTPTNFSPSQDVTSPDSRYLTHEWFLLQQPPRQFPVNEMANQNSYLPEDIDLAKARSANPSDSLYLSSYFTVESSDYSSEFSDPKSDTKEFFTPMDFNPANGFYETLFRGMKVILKRRSDLSAEQASSLDKFVPFFRGFEDYKFAALLRPITEDSSTIQSPVSYEIIENSTQKFILFICNVVMSDYKSQDLGYTGGTGGNPILDFTLQYALSSKEVLLPSPSGTKFYEISDIKLSTALDLSLASGSEVNTTLSPGIINSFVNPFYDVDLREEINTFFVENSPGATSAPTPTGRGSFYVPALSTTYPWPIGVGPNYIEFGKVATGSANYTFTIPFSFANPVTIPVGPSSIYKDKPVFQVEGGENYYDSILKRISASEVARRVNSSSPYIVYTTYSWDSSISQTVAVSNKFELYFEKPTKIFKTFGSRATKYFGGPQKAGEAEPTAYIIQSNQNLPSSLLRYSGGYEPIFRKVIFFDNDKNDTIVGDSSVDLSFRNCNFAPGKKYFGISRNLPYTKVSLQDNILSLSQNLPEGSVYPLVGQSPIFYKNFNLFSSSWDPGYYERFTAPETFTRVAGTRSMLEYKTFFGSKIMKTPSPVGFPNYITLQISKTEGNSNVSQINEQINSYIKSIQDITPAKSAQGIGSVGPYLSGVDLQKLDLSIFPNAELVWQYFSETNTIQGTIRLDRMLRRSLLNSGIKQVFINNMISDFGVGNPDSIDDDVNQYIELNVSPLYQGSDFSLFVKKNGSQTSSEMNPNFMVRGDISTSSKFKDGYFYNKDFTLTRVQDLIYNFQFPLEKSYTYSILFDFGVKKI
jgi:hypothetical protein